MEVNTSQGLKLLFGINVSFLSKTAILFVPLAL